MQDIQKLQSSLWQKALRKKPRELASLAFRRGLDRLVLAAYRLRYPRVCFGKGMTIRGRLIIRGPGQLTFGNYVGIQGTLIINTEGEVTVGPHTGFACFRHQINRIDACQSSARVVVGPSGFFNGAHVAAWTTIEFGKQCIVSDALIEDNDYHSIEINRRDPAAPVKSFPISVGENVWIGSRAAVLKGVTIGNNSVVGLGTIVRKSVPENCVVIGNPQQIAKQLDASIAPYEPPSYSAG